MPELPFHNPRSRPLSYVASVVVFNSRETHETRGCPPFRLFIDIILRGIVRLLFMTLFCISDRSFFANTQMQTHLQFFSNIRARIQTFD